MKSIFLILTIMILIFTNITAADIEINRVDFGGEEYLIENYQKFNAQFTDYQRPVVGVALSGGGARAMVNFGVVKALEEEGIPMDFLAGTSMGAIVSTLYGSGLNTEQMIDVVTTTSFGELINVSVSGGDALVDTKGLNIFMEAIVPNKRLDDFEIPVALLSFELSEGKKYVTTSGNISDVIQSAYSIPFYFPIESRGKMHFMDAGILEATPAKAAAVMGANFVIATSSFAEKEYKDLANATTSIDRFINIMQDNFSQQVINNYADFLIEIDVADYSFMDFNRADRLIELGYNTTMQKMPELKAKLAEKDIELIDYAERKFYDISNVMNDLKNNRFIVPGYDSGLFLDYSKNKSYFDQELITGFEDNFESGLNFKYDNFLFNVKGDDFFKEGYELQFKAQKLTELFDIVLTYGNDYDSRTKDDYRIEYKYFGDHFNSGLGFGRQQDKEYYLLGSDFSLKGRKLTWGSENDLIYIDDDSNLSIISSNLFNFNIGGNWDLESAVVYNNTGIINSPIIYRGQKLKDPLEFQTRFDFKYSHSLIKPIYFTGLFQTTDIGGYLFANYFDDGYNSSGQAVGFGFESQLYLMGLSPMKIDLYFAYDYEIADDRVGLELRHNF